jgi:tetratricopeptide (TPR) repeat protein
VREEAHGRRLLGALPLALLGAVLLVTVAVYARVLPGELQFDDVASVERNPAVKDLRRFGAPATWSLPTRPLTELTLAVDYRIGRLEPFGYHATNIAIHLAAVVLVYLLSLRTLRSAGEGSPAAVAAVVAGLFALHPLQTESVSYVIQRAEALASLLYVAALVLLLETEAAATRWRSALAYSGAVVAGAAALAAKPMAATLPAAYLLLTGVFPPAGTGRVGAGRRLALSLPFFALSGLAAWQGLHASAGSGHAGFGIEGLGLPDYLLTQPRVLFRYLRLIALPIGQNVDPDVAVSRSLLDPATITAALVLAALATGAVLLLSGRVRAGPGRWEAVGRLAAFRFAWFVLLLLPPTLVPLADVMAEHRVYLASWGVFLAAAMAGASSMEAVGLAPRARVAVAAALLGALAVATWTRNAVWTTQVALWSDAAAKSPAKARPFQNLGWAFKQGGDHARALSAYREALERSPDPRRRAEIFRGMGSSLVRLGLHDQADAALAVAAEHPDVEADARSLLAVSLLDRGRLDAAREQALLALQRDPGHGAARNTLGQVLLAQDDPSGALAQFRIAVELDPDVAPRRLNVALALERLGRAAEACAAWGEYLAVEKRAGPRAAALEHLRATGCGTSR